MPRAKRLTTQEAADLLSLSTSQVANLARNRIIGRKEKGVWAFFESEIKRYKQERDDHAKALKIRQKLEREDRRWRGLPPKRKKRTPRLTEEEREERRDTRRRNERMNMEAVNMLDRILAEERRLEQKYQLPFRGPINTTYGIGRCLTCNKDRVLLINAERAKDLSGLEGYERLMQNLIEELRLPTFIRALPVPPPPDPNSKMLVLEIWPNGSFPRANRQVTETEWNEIMEEFVAGHCPANEERTQTELP